MVRQYSSTLACVGVLSLSVLGLSSAPSHADTMNRLVLIEGEDNRLQIEVEEHNSAKVTISGYMNGESVGVWPASGAFIDMPPPGSIFQTGLDNALDIEILGNQNLFAVLQSGQANSITGFVLGSGNAAAISQAGSHNVASFSQIGTGNALAITQTSW